MKRIKGAKPIIVKTAVLISESSVFTDKKGQLISKGGGEGSFHKLGVALVELGVSVKVFAIQEFAEQKAHETIDGVEYFRISVRAKTSLRILKYLKWAIVGAREADYVFVNQFTPHLVLPFLSRMRSKTNSKTRGPRKIIAVIHDVYKEKGIGFWIKQFGLVAGVVGASVERLQLRFDRKYADEILTVSEESKRKILSAFGARSNKFGKKIHVVTWPVSSDSANGSVNDTTKQKILLKDKKDLILFVGRFVDYKNPSHVLHVLKEIKKSYPKFQAVFVASRIDKKVVKEFTELRWKLGLTARDVVIEENISRENLQKYYKSAKILVHPSHIEGQGMVIPEALAWKTPVVAYDLEAYKGIFTNQGFKTVQLKEGQSGLANACLKILKNYSNNFEKTSPDTNDNKKFIKVVEKLISE